MANSALKEQAGVHARAQQEGPAPVRVILPSSAQAAEAKPLPQQAEQPVAPSPQALPPAKEAQALEKAETNIKADADKRPKRSAERKARRLVARRYQRPERRPTDKASVLAFGSDEPRTASGNLNFFGN
jgi:hypothetical protein